MKGSAARRVFLNNGFTVASTGTTATETNTGGKAALHSDTMEFRTASRFSGGTV